MVLSNPQGAAVAARDLTFELTPVSGSVNGVGNNLCITPSSGARLRLYYVSYNPSQSVQAGFRFGDAGILWLLNTLTIGGAVVAKDFGTRYVEGAVDESLYLYLDGAVATIWNAFYREA